MAFWLCRVGSHGEHEQKFVSDNRIYATWWGLDDDLSKFSSRQDIAKFLRQKFDDWGKKRASHYAGQLWTFKHRMQAGDLVASPTKRKTIHIGKIKDSYHFDPNAENPYYHWRSVDWLETDIPRTNFDQDILKSLGAFTTICRIQRNDAESRVRAMQDNNWTSVGVKPKLPDDINDVEDVEAQSYDLEDIATDEIARLIYSKYKGSGLELLVEAVLKAKGYTTFHSPAGADGGVDILAAPGSLGFGKPRICVQVKSQAGQVERMVLDQLVGTMQNVQADQGLLVSWGGFKRSIKSEVSRLYFKVRLWDQRDFINEFLENYENLDEDIKAELPLKRIWTVASAKED